jgi:hypothetical protein
MIPFMWALLRRWLLGDDQRQQIRASQALLVLGVYVVFAGVQHAEVMLGMIDEAASWRLSAYKPLLQAHVVQSQRLRCLPDPVLTSKIHR